MLCLKVRVGAISGKAQRSGLTVTRSQTDDALTFLHTIHEKNIRSIGGLPKQRSFFRKIAEILPRDAWTIYLAERDNVKVAALLLLYGNQTVEYYTPCVVEEHRSTQALSLLVYHAMVDAMKNGYRQWNWGGLANARRCLCFQEEVGHSGYPLSLLH